jgi:hypothetical protein
MSKQVLFFLSPFSFNSARPNWDFETNTLSDRWSSAFRSLWQSHSLSRLSWNHLLTAHSKSVMSCEFFQMLGIFSTRFLCRNCPLGFLFEINVLCEYFKLIKWPACFITIRSILKMMITSVFSNVWRETSNHGIRNQLVLRRLWYIFYTILLHVFLRIWSISNWMLSLVPTFFKYGNNTSKYFKHNGHLTFGWICQELDRTVGQKVCQNRGFYVASGIISTAGEDQKWHGKIGE